MWLDDCRIPFVDELDPSAKTYETPKKHWVGFVDDNTENKLNTQYKEQQGRFTPNLLVCDDLLNDGSVSKSQRGRNDVGKPTYTGNSLLNSKTTMNNTDRGFDDKGSNSRYYDLDTWFDKIIERI
jgi:hypothetical protein